jgi:HAE1 family hydrophobic/amphiphilic exporter-1
VTEPLEEALGSLSGVKTVTSNSSENVSSITVEFDLEYSAVQAASDVRERVAAVRGTFPNDVQDPLIQRFDFTQLPILTIAVADREGKIKPDELRRLVEDKIKPRLDRVDGVADVAVSGGLVREIQIALKLDEMRLRRISPQQVVAAIQTENLNLPGGKVTDNGQEINVRTPGNFQSVDEIDNAIISSAAARRYMSRMLLQ